MALGIKAKDISKSTELEQARISLPSKPKRDKMVNHRMDLTTKFILKLTE